MTGRAGVDPAGRDILRYDATTIVLHWLVAALVLALLAGGAIIAWLPLGVFRADARSLHVTLGLLLGALGGARFVWRLSWGSPLPPADSGLLGELAKATHNGLYALLAAMVCVGILLAWTTGDSVFNQVSTTPPAPDVRALALQLRRVHGVIAWLIVGLAGAHTFAVLVHHFALRDGVLGRMATRGQSSRRRG